VSAARAESNSYVTSTCAVGTRTSDTPQPVIHTAAFGVDLAAKRVTRQGDNVHLTLTEWGMLEILVRNPEKLVGQEDDPSHPKHLITEAGMGYRFQR
jgi:two-component system KDP operon response regulator KdpE